MLFVSSATVVLLRFSTFTFTVVVDELYVSLPGYVTINVLGPTGISTGISTIPVLLVLPVTSVPLGNVTTTVALLIGSLVTGSTKVTFTVVFPNVVLVTSAVILLKRPTTSVTPRG